MVAADEVATVAERATPFGSAVQLTHFFKIVKSFARAFSKARRSRATPLSLSAESETPLGEAQHFFFLKSADFIRR